MGQELTLAMRLLLDAQRFTAGLTNSRGAISRFVGGARTELDRLRASFSSVQGRLAQAGLSVGATALAVQSAKLDKNITQIGLTAGVQAGEIQHLRDEIFRLSRDTGQPLEELLAGFNNLVQSGLNWNESLRVIEATNKALAVTEARADALTGGLAVASTAFQFDLSKPQLALTLLDKMVVAGRLGNAELDNLSSIFARVGVNAQAAGLSFDKTLSFIEALSLVERQPERLATLADSTLRIFTNARYRKEVQKATGIRFFDTSGTRRDALDVLGDMRARFAQLQTDAQRENFISKAFGQTDLDTQRGLRTLLSGDTLSRMSEFTRQVGAAAGTLDQDMQRGINNAVDQVGRLKSVLRDTADSFAQRLNAGVSSGIKKLLDTKQQGGLELSGGEIVGGAAATLVAGYLGKRFGGPLLKRVLGKGTNLAEGIAVGKGLESAGAATPVYVVNMPAGGIGGAIGDVAVGAGSVAAGSRVLKMFGGLRAAAAIVGSQPTLAGIGTLGAGGIATAAGGVLGAGALGYGAGSLLYRLFDDSTFADKLGEGIARALAAVNFGESRSAVASRDKYEGSLKIELSDKRARVTELKAPSPFFDLSVQNGLMWSIP